MSKISIRKGIDAALKPSGNKILQVEFLGIGGAFDTEEGTASALFTTNGGMRFLIDCGYTAYSKLRKSNLLDSIDRVFITHTHEDHINGLSTLIYDRFFIHNKTTVIECHKNVSDRVRQYLDICGHPHDQYVINEVNVFLEDENISITKIDTSAHHWPVNNFPNSGLLFHIQTKDDYAVVIYSGDINVPITDLMPEEDYSFVYEKPDNVFIFHDMTDLVHDQNPHCNFELLEPVKQKFKNLLTYHHNENQISNISSKMPHIAYTSMILQEKSFVIEEGLGI